MKRFLLIFSVICVIGTLAFSAEPAWRHHRRRLQPVPPVPQPAPVPIPDPQPNPEPKPSPQPVLKLANVVFVDPDNEPDWFGAVLTGTARKYLDAQGHQLQLVTRGLQVADIAPYQAKLAELDKANGKPVDLPLLMLGSGGKPLAWMAMPQSADHWIAAVKSQEKPDPQTVLIGTNWRKLVLKKSDPKKLRAAWKGHVYGDDTPNEPVLPKEKWAGRDFGDWATDVLDQGQTSMCCPSATSMLDRSLRNICGFNDAALSVADLYRQGMALEGDFGDNGLQISTAMHVLFTSGVCTTHYADQWNWYNPDYKPGYQQDRAKHTLLKAYWCPSLDCVCSALTRCRPVAIGVEVTRQFSNPVNGVIGPKQGHGGGGHCILLLGLRTDAHGDICFLMQNSWGKEWGGSSDGSVRAGQAWMHSSWYEPAYGAFTAGLVATDPDDPFTVKNAPRVRPPTARLHPTVAIAP